MWQCDSISSHKQKPTSEVEKGAVEQKPDPEETKALAEALKESGDALDKKFGPAIKVRLRNLCIMGENYILPWQKLVCVAKREKKNMGEIERKGRESRTKSI